MRDRLSACPRSGRRACPHRQADPEKPWGPAPFRRVFARGPSPSRTDWDRHHRRGWSQSLPQYIEDFSGSRTKQMPPHRSPQ